MKLSKTFIALLVSLGIIAMCGGCSSNDSDNGGYSSRLNSIALWPDGAPTPNGLEKTSEKREGNVITGISRPSMLVYPAENPNGQMVICCPGGSYSHLNFATEGTDFCQWLNSQGITVGVLKYRMPNGHKEVLLEDGRRAIELAKLNAGKWGVDPSKIGIMGCSTGGHFAATTATMCGDDAHRPAFQILLYPLISMEDNLAHIQSRENLLGSNPTSTDKELYSIQYRVDGSTPAAFIAVSDDDSEVSPDNSRAYCDALTAQGVPCTHIVYPTGGHGWGFRDSFIYKTQLTISLQQWLAEQNK